MYACLAVTCHLHFWQNDRDFLRATVVTRGWNGYRNKSQHRKSSLEKKILPPFQQGFEPATFQSRVRCSNHWAIPAPHWLYSQPKSFYSQPTTKTADLRSVSRPSSLPILMQEPFWRWKCSHRYNSLPLPPPPYTSPPSPRLDVKHHVYLLTSVSVVSTP